MLQKKLDNSSCIVSLSKSTNQMLESISLKGVQFKYLFLKVLDPDRLLNPIGDCLVSFQSLNWQLLKEEAIPKKTTEQKADKTRRLGRLGSITGAGGASGKKPHIPIELPYPPP